MRKYKQLDVPKNWRQKRITTLTTKNPLIHFIRYYIWSEYKVVILWKVCSVKDLKSDWRYFGYKLNHIIHIKTRRTDRIFGKFVYYCVTGIVYVRKSNERVCFCNFESSFKADLELLFALFSKEKLFDVNNNHTKKLF